LKGIICFLLNDVVVAATCAPIDAQRSKRFQAAQDLGDCLGAHDDIGHYIEIAWISVFFGLTHADIGQDKIRFVDERALL
jgi:hypothetical protein